MKNLVLVGTGSLAREIYSGAKYNVGYNTEWVVKGFIKDANFKEIDNFERYCPEGILGTIDDYEVSENDVFFNAVGDIGLRMQWVEKLKKRGAKFMNLIHKTAVILDYVTMGEGVAVGLNSTVSCNVTIGDFSTMGTGVAIGHDVIIGDHCAFAAFCHVGGYVSIGSRSLIYTAAIILPKISLAENTVVGANSLVIRSIKNPGQTWFGSPAKRLG